MKRDVLRVAMILLVVAGCIRAAAWSVDAAEVPVYELQVRLSPETHSLQGSARIVLLEGVARGVRWDGLDIKAIRVNGKVREPTDDVLKDAESGVHGKVMEIEYEASFHRTDPAENIENVGVVTTILDKNDVDISKAVAVVCGPPIMMRFVTLNLLDFGFKGEQIYLSMEKNMSCGIGKCGHCMLGKYYVCKEGPVFTYEQIKNYPNIWD